MEGGDWVYLKIKPYRHTTVVVRANLKLSSEYYGPYQVLEKGAIAYKFQLPLGTLIHLLFHVSQLKRRIGPMTGPNGLVLAKPVVTVDKMMIKR